MKQFISEFINRNQEPRHCTRSSLKLRFVELIDTMPPHEGKTFEEALADWLIQNGATLPERKDKNAQNDY